MDYELDNIPMWKEAVVAYFKAIFRHLLEGTEEIHEIFIGLTGRDSNAGLLEYEGAVLPTQQRVFFKFVLARFWVGKFEGSCFDSRLCGPSRPPSQVLMWAMYLGERRPGREFNHSKYPVTSLTLRRLMSYIYMEHPFLMFLDHTQRRSTVGRTPLDE